MIRFDDTPWDLAPRREDGDVAAIKRSSPSSQLAEAIQHLEKVTMLMIQYQTDWVALLPTMPSGAVNNDYDPLYEAKIRENPEEVYDPALLEARNFLKRIHSH
jgi:hypothetical protein